MLNDQILVLENKKLVLSYQVMVKRWATLSDNGIGKLKFGAALSDYGMEKLEGVLRYQIMVLDIKVC